MDLRHIYQFRQKHSQGAEGLRKEWKELLDNGCDPNETWEDRYAGLCTSPLFRAVLDHDADTARLLLQYKADLERRNDVGRNVLHEAIVRSYSDLINLFLEHGADPNAQVTSAYLEGGTALHLAAAEGQVETVRSLLSHGADPELKTRQGWTAFDMAILDRQNTLVSTFLEHLDLEQMMLDVQQELKLLSTYDVEPNDTASFARELIEHGLRNAQSQHRKLYLQYLAQAIDLHAAGMTEATKLGLALVNEVEARLLGTCGNPGSILWPRDLCTQCKRFQTQDNSTIYKVFEHSPDLESVKQSASHGCSLCHFLLECINFNWCLLHQIGQEWRDEFAVEPALRLRVESKDNSLNNLFGAHRLIVVCGEKIAFVDLDHVQSVFDTKCPFGCANTRLDQMNSAIAETGPSDTEGTGSERTLRTTKAWLQRCLEEHPSCKAALRGGLPTRVVYVGNESTPPHVYLSEGEEQPYVALSYCWGDETKFWSENSNIDAYSEALPLDIMPQTFLDAITITRALGLKYLWMDALCILQDSRKDKVHEIAHMGEIFARAHLTIAAKVSRGALDGIFRSRAWPASAVFPLDLRLPSRVRESDSRIDGRMKNTRTSQMNRLMALMRHNRWPREEGRRHLDTRGWALQEQCLSRRMLNFEQGEVTWTCVEAKCSERQPEEDNAAGYFNWVGAFRHVFATGELGAGKMPHDLESLFESWQETVEDYSERQLTDPSDKLTAIAGVQSAIGEHLQDMPVAGLWKGRFFSPSLLWRVSESGAKEGSSRFPSWSWASTTSPVKHIRPGSRQVKAGSSYDEVAFFPEVLSWHLESIDQLDGIGGYVYLRCKLIRLTALSQKWRDTMKFEMHFDTAKPDGEEDVWLMLVRTSHYQTAEKYKMYNHRYDIYTTMLLVQRLDADSMDFKRIGLATATSGGLKWHEKTQSMDIRFF